MISMKSHIPSLLGCLIFHKRRTALSGEALPVVLAHFRKKKKNKTTCTVSDGSTFQIKILWPALNSGLFLTPHFPHIVVRHRVLLMLQGLLWDRGTEISKKAY